MTTPQPKVPLERDTFTRVQIRVAVRLVVLDYHRHAKAYAAHPPTAVLNLAGRLRLLFPSMFSALTFVAKALAQGYRLAVISSLSLEPAPRSLAKRRVRRV